MKIEEFGMDTVSLPGTLEAKLQAIADAGFSQIMLGARDLVAHPNGLEAAIAAVRSSRLRVTGYRVLRDFEGLEGTLHQYKVDIAKSMIEMCAALGCRVLLTTSSTLAHSSDDPARAANDLRKLATLAIPHGISVAFEALSWGRTIREFSTAWEAVTDADCPNLGIAIDSFHVFAANTPLERLDDLDPLKIFLVQLSDFMWQEAHSFEERIATARHFRVFPGEGAHSKQLAELVVRLDELGYRGDYSFDVFNDDYRQLPMATIAQRARRSALWLAEDVLRRSPPLTNPRRWQGSAPAT